jgi:tetratricopeptide (TPR) repeat protein
MRAKIRNLLLFVSLLATLPALAEEGVADARRHMIRGVAAIEMAKNAAELAPAAEEFRRATELDPTLSAAWYNLGSVQVKLGQFDEAIQSYKRYLTLSPQAEDAQKIQDEIIKLEYKQEKVNTVANFSATWTAGENSYVISVNKLEFNLKGTEQMDSSARGIKLISDGGFLLGKMDRTPSGTADVIFKGRIDGSSIKGTRTRGSFVEGLSSCTVPVDQGEFTGTSEDVQPTPI